MIDVTSEDIFFAVFTCVIAIFIGALVWIIDQTRYNWCDLGCRPVYVIECPRFTGKVWCSDDKIHWRKAAP